MRKRNSLFSSFISMLQNEFRGYNGKALAADVIAGITVGAVALPLALAFGAASVSAEYAAIGISAGLITAILAGIISGLLGGGSFQISGPTGAMTVILGSVVAGEYGLTGMFLATFLAGVILLLCGLLHVGTLIRFIPKPVITGFTSGIAIVIALGQLGNFFGVTLTGETTLDKVICFFTEKLGEISVPALICSLLVVFLMVLYPKKAAKYVPGSLVAIIVITVVVAIFKMDVRTIGAIPTSLVNTEHLRIGAVSGAMLRSVAPSAVTIALLGMVESLLCGTCAANMKKEPFDSNIEMIAQGVGNMVIPFFGGVPSTAAIARTSVAVKSGGRTRLTSVFQSLFLVACMFVLSGAIGMVPYAALAGVLVVTAFRMNDWEQIRSYCKGRQWGAVLQFAVTMVATVLLDLTYAILIGVLLAFVLLVLDLCKIELKCTAEDRTLTVSGKGAYFFANVGEVRALTATASDAERVVFDLTDVHYVDLTAVETLREIRADLTAAGKTVSFVGVRPAAARAFERAGAGALLGK